MIPERTNVLKTDRTDVAGWRPESLTEGHSKEITMASLRIRHLRSFALTHPICTADQTMLDGHQLKLDGGKLVALTINK